MTDSLGRPIGDNDNAVELKLAPQDIQQRVLGYFVKADEQFAAGVRAEMVGQQ